MKRKKKDSNPENKDKVITFRVSRIQKETLTRLARHRGFTSLGSYAKFLAFSTLTNEQVKKMREKVERWYDKEYGL